MLLVVWNETARTAGAFYMCVATFGSYVFREMFPAKKQVFPKYMLSQNPETEIFSN